TEMKKLPPFVLLENVEGLLAPDEGNDLRSILWKLNELGYYVDLLRIDASHFVPQSRVRLFMIGTHKSLAGHLKLDARTKIRNMKGSNARPKKIIDYILKNRDLRWYFHKLPNLPVRAISLTEIIDRDAAWWSRKRAQYLYKQMHQHQRKIIAKKKN